MNRNDAHTAEWRARPVLVNLMGGFEAELNGSPIPLPLDAQRLIAFLALEGRPRSRAHVAGKLWNEGSQERAYGNLRSALWRVRKEVSSLINADTQTVSLVPGVRTDLKEMEALVAHLGKGQMTHVDVDVDLSRFGAELLEGWYDDWMLVERERVRQMCLHALESLAQRQLSIGRFAHALETAIAAVALEPLRESAHRVVIEIHLSEGNHGEALRHYKRFSELLQAELGLRPSPLIEKQMSSLPLAV